MLKCRYCGTANPAGTTYCNSCGGALGAVPAGNAAGAAGGARAAAVGGRPVAGYAASATATPPPHPHNLTGALPPQTRLNRRYLVLSAVGQGGMAAVYRGIDTRGNRQVAIKEMSQDGLSATEEIEALAAFRSEAELLKRLNHRNLPKVIDIFSEGTRHYLVMEFVEGQTLEQRQQAAGGGPLPEAEVLGWAEQICSVLAYLHALRPPIVFRDLKPANIMVTPAGQIKLIDFGIARVFTPGRLKDTQILGTPGFAPPEQYGRTQTDARADIYALGVTLYQLLTGYDPATSPFSLPPANSRNPKITPRIQAAIEHATRLDRETRYATVADFERDLLRPDGFVFRNGQRARTVAELIALCRANPLEAQDHLYSGRLETWLTSTGQTQAARAAGVVVKLGGNHATGLEAFMLQATRPQQAQGSAQPRPRPAPAAARPAPKAPPQPPRSPAGTSTAARIANQLAATTMRRVAAQAAAMAASYVGTQILLEVRPRTVDFGVVLAGQKSTVSVAIGGQFGLPVTGRVASLAAWLKVDPASFVGTSSAVRLTADTTRLPQAGRHQTTLEITSGTQKVYIPVTVEVLATQATRAAPPPRAAGAPKAPKAPKPPKASKASGVAARLFRRAPRVPNPPGPKPQAPAATKAPKAARAASARAAPGGKHTVASAATAWTRLLTAWVLVCGLGGWAALELLALAAARVVVLPAWLPLGVALPLAMLLVAPVAAVTGHWGPDTFKRAGTALLCAGAGLGLVLLLAPGWHLDPFAMVALPPWRAATAIAVPLALRPVLLLSLLGVSVGATLGVTPLLSGYLRRVLAFAARHRRALSIVVAVGLGGWAGASLLHWVGSPLPPGVDSFLAFFGAIAGMVATAALAYRANRVLGRLQRTAAHP